MDGMVQLGESLPFNQHLRVEALEVRDGYARTRMAADDRFGNHLGGVHAIAELAPAEFCGALAASSRLVPLLERGYVPVVGGLEVRYRVPAYGELVATATVPDDVLGPAMETADAGEKPRLDVDVEVADAAGTVVARVRLHFVYLPVEQTVAANG